AVVVVDREVAERVRTGARRPRAEAHEQRDDGANTRAEPQSEAHHLPPRAAPGAARPSFADAGEMDQSRSGRPRPAEARSAGASCAGPGSLSVTRRFARSYRK